MVSLFYTQSWFPDGVGVPPTFGCMKGWGRCVIAGWNPGLGQAALNLFDQIMVLFPVPLGSTLTLLPHRELVVACELSHLFLPSFTPDNGLNAPIYESVWGFLHGRLKGCYLARLSKRKLNTRPIAIRFRSMSFLFFFVHYSGKQSCEILCYVERRLACTGLRSCDPVGVESKSCIPAGSHEGKFKTFR
jgi:hypothetical protein